MIDDNIYNASRSKCLGAQPCLPDLPLNNSFYRHGNADLDYSSKESTSRMVKGSLSYSLVTTSASGTLALSSSSSLGFNTSLRYPRSELLWNTCTSVLPC